MSMKLQRGSPPLTDAERAGMALTRKIEPQPVFSANNPDSVELDRQLPLVELELILTGTYTATSPGPTTVRDGAAALINRLELVLDGDQTLMRLPGWFLRFYHWYNNRWDYRATDVVASDESRAFDLRWSLPIDVGSYLSCLDASGATQLTLEILWAAADDIANGASEAVSGVNLTVNSLAPSGRVPGERGGTGFPYWRRMVNHRIVTVTAANADLRVELTGDREYNSITLVTISDDVYVDTILNRATIQIGQTRIQAIERENIQLRNYHNAHLESGDWVGVYHIDLARDNHLEQLLRGQDPSEPELRLDVANPGSTDQIFIIEDYFVTPVPVAG